LRQKEEEEEEEEEEGEDKNPSINTRRSKAREFHAPTTLQTCSDPWSKELLLYLSSHTDQLYIQDC